MIRHAAQGVIKGLVMTISNNSNSVISGQLKDQITGLSDAAAHLSINQIANHVDDIRKVARDNGLCALADIAQGLESALARSDSPLVIQSWLHVMGEAVTEQGSSDAWLASIGRRLYG
jgi:hypothetical protein